MHRDRAQHLLIVLVVVIFAGCDLISPENATVPPLPSEPAVDSGSGGAKIAADARVPSSQAAPAAPTGSSVDLTSQYLLSVKASSELRDGKVLYAASWAADGDRQTAWGAKREQYRYEWLELRFTQPVTVTELKVLTGYSAKSKSSGDDLFPLNRRIKQARITVGDSKGFVHDFADDREWQSVPVAPPVTGTKLQFTILDVYQGSRFPDLHVSEISVWGPSEGEGSNETLGTIPAGARLVFIKDFPIPAHKRGLLHLTDKVPWNVVANGQKRDILMDCSMWVLEKQAEDWVIPEKTALPIRKVGRSVNTRGEGSQYTFYFVENGLVKHMFVNAGTGTGAGGIFSEADTFMTIGRFTAFTGGYLRIEP